MMTKEKCLAGALLFKLYLLQLVNFNGIIFLSSSLILRIARGQQMKKRKWGRREKYSRALFLFGQCHSVSKVAYELGIPYKEAKQLHIFYLNSQAFDAEIEKDINEYYASKLDGERKETVERIIKNVKEEMRNPLKSASAIRDNVVLMREYISEYGAEALEIFFYNHLKKCLSRWAKEDWENSPFWLNFQSRFYCRRDSCFYYN